MDRRVGEPQQRRYAFLTHVHSRMVCFFWFYFFVCGVVVVAPSRLATPAHPKTRMGGAAIFSCVQTSRRLTSTKLSSMTTCNQNQSISSSSNWVCILLYRNSANEAFKVESLLIEKPDNPIGFVVDYLQKKSVYQLLSNF